MGTVREVLILLVSMTFFTIAATLLLPLKKQIDELANLQNGFWIAGTKTKYYEYILPQSDWIGSVKYGSMDKWPPNFGSYGIIPGESKKFSIFLVGDSLDARFLWISGPCAKVDYFPRDSNICEKNASAKVAFWAKPKQESHACVSRSFIIANLFTRGIIDGEHQNEVCEVGLPLGLQNSISYAVQQFKLQYGDPDLVVFKSFYWDIMHICRNQGVRCDDMLLDAPALSQLITDFGAHAATALHHLQKQFPKSLVAIRTDPMWSAQSSRFGGHPSGEIAVGQHIREALRNIATKEGALFFDFHNIVSSLPPEVYLDDDIHLQDDPYSIIELNIMTRTVLAGWPLDEPNDVEAPPHLVDGKLVMGSDQPHIYLVEQQTLRKIPDMATFEAHGWDFDDVARVWQASLDRYPRGPDIPIA